jgi:HEAT repeat protein
MHDGIQEKCFEGELARLVQSALVRIGAEAVPVLQPLLAASDSSVQLAALATLGRMGAGASEALTAIVGLVDDLDQLVCCQALTTLGKIGSEAKAAIPVILRALQDEDFLIRMNALLALRKLAPELADVNAVNRPRCKLLP